MLPTTDAMLMIAPPPRAIMPGSTARIVRTIDLTLRSKAKSSSSGLHVEDRSDMDDAGAVEQDVDGADLRHGRVDRRAVEDIQPADHDAGLAVEFRQRLRR